jgi:hypothetical protein
MNPNEAQPAPTAGEAVPTWQLVIDDMRERDQWGSRKYGTRHQYDNGRDHLVDAYQEALDLAVYLRAEIEKRRGDTEAGELRGILATLAKALGMQASTVEEMVRQIVWLRSLVRK